MDTHLISLDQNFSCDTSYTANKVSLIAVETVNGEHIADLEYNITEYADGNFKSPFSSESVGMMMKMTYHALAKFSVERGRWVFYNGIMTLTSTGFMGRESTQKLALIAQ